MASHFAVSFEHGEGEEDYLQQGNESYATNHRHLQELHRLSAFQQVTTKVPPSYDGRGSWFAYEDAIDDWCDITELDDDKRGANSSGSLHQCEVYRRSSGHLSHLHLCEAHR